MPFKIKRVYEPRGTDDGMRVLVDRLWPRGLKKSDAALDAWMKEVAPSPELRTWFAHDPGKFADFSARYRRELKGSAALGELRALGRGKPVTLLFAAHDPKINHAAVLKAALTARAGSAKRKTTRPRSSR
ncbi:MAG TPA: DUF488 domain-containing protein [Steroidobacteraceae bacterium]|jgi:uncharacterized protein YeaO (DUF488 family)